MTYFSNCFYSNYKSNSIVNKLILANIPVIETQVPSVVVNILWQQVSSPNYDLHVAFALVPHGQSPNAVLSISGGNVTTSNWTATSTNTFLLYTDIGVYTSANPFNRNATFQLDVFQFNNFISVNSITTGNFDVYMLLFGDAASPAGQIALDGNITMAYNLSYITNPITPLPVIIYSGGLSTNAVEVNGLGEMLVSGSGGGGGDVNIATINGITPLMVDNKLVVVPTNA